MQILISSGNTKLPKTTAIFNMSSASNCPSRKRGLCKAIVNGKNRCYAFKAERFYPTCKPYRDKQELFWKSSTDKSFVQYFLALNTLSNNKFDTLRFNEAGDFHTQKCVDKAEKIATSLKQNNIKTYTYTSRSDLNFSNIKNLIILGSGFTKDGISGIFKMIQKSESIPEGFQLCPMNCKICKRCLNGQNTVVRQH